MRHTHIPLLLFFFSASATAGVFNTPRFLPAGSFAAGLEPEIQLSDGTGIGANVRFGQGLTDLSNVNLLVGTGGGGRKFRFGGNVTFDFFPDIQGQPGIGLALQGIFYRIGASGSSSTAGQLDLVGMPYIHKTFAMSGKDEIEPYLAVPIGAAFSGGQYTGISSLVVGAMFKNVEKLRYVVELGLSLNDMYTYASGGIMYYF